MKKVILSLAVLFSVAMVSCGDKKAEATDSMMDTTATEEVVDSMEEAPATDSEAPVAEVAEAPAADSVK